MSKKKESIKNLYFVNSSTNWMCEIEDYYLQSTVSYYGLQKYVPHYSTATQIIKGAKLDRSTIKPDRFDSIVASCKILYGLLHARFIVSEDGCEKMNSKYNHGVFGRCPRESCNGQHCLPIGLSQIPGQSTVKIFCPRCYEVYDCDSDLDGAYFGPDFPAMFMKVQNIPFRAPIPSPFLAGYKLEDGTEIPPIEQRLVRWNEKKPAM